MPAIEMLGSALVVGASGIVGSNLARHLAAKRWQVHGLARHPRNDIDSVIPVSADLLDPASLRASLEGLHPTHVFISAWLRQPTEKENIQVNSAMVRNLLDALSSAGSVRHVGLVTGLKHYLGPFEAYGKGVLPATPFREEQPRLDVDNFYYAQEDEVFAAARRDGFGWSVHRPHTIIGYAIGNAMNMGVTLAVYATLCRETGRQFVFPGSAMQWNGLTDMTDAGLLAHHLEWAATTPAARDQAFNVVNGDIFRWSWMWPRIAEWFGVEPAPFPAKTLPLEYQLADAGPLWADIARKYSLAEPNLAVLASPWHTDADLGRPVEVVTDMPYRAENYIEPRHDEDESDMKQRIFGGSTAAVSEVGLGCWQLGGTDWGDVSADDALAILRASAESGVTFFDTADVYGGGRSEELIGTFLKQNSVPVFVATKLGRAGDPGGQANFTRAAVRAHTEASLRRLGVETLDLTQLHCVPPEVLTRGEVFEWLRELRQEGKIQRFGASVESMDEAQICLEQDGLAALQIIFNIFRQKPITTLFDTAKARNVALIVRLPLASGLLSGKYKQDTQFPQNDHRTYNRDGQAFNVGETFAGLPFALGVTLADALKPLVPDGMTEAQMALRWCLDFEAVTTIIPGAKNPAMAKANAAVSALPPLSPALHAQISEFYKTQVAAHIRGPY